MSVEVFQKYHYIYRIFCFRKCLIPVVLLYTDSIFFILMYLLSLLAIDTLLMVSTEINLRYFNTIENQLFKEMHGISSTCNFYDFLNLSLSVSLSYYSFRYPSLTFLIRNSIHFFLDFFFVISS